MSFLIPVANEVDVVPNNITIYDKLTSLVEVLNNIVIRLTVTGYFPNIRMPCVGNILRNEYSWTTHGLIYEYQESFIVDRHPHIMIGTVGIITS